MKPYRMIRVICPGSGLLAFACVTAWTATSASGQVPPRAATPAAAGAIVSTAQAPAPEGTAPLGPVVAPVIAHPSDAWTNRDSPDSVASATQDFFKLLEFNNLTLRRPKLAEANQLAQSGKYAEALASFSNYFLDKLHYPANYGIAVQDLTPYSSPPYNAPPDQAKTLADADLLMAGKGVFGRGAFARQVTFGEPGTIDWSMPWDDKPHMARQASMSLHTGEAFLPLANAYLMTHDKRYLDRWVAYLDDWSFNDHYFETVDPCLISDSANSDSGTMALRTLDLLSALQSSGPEGASAVPPRVLAQVLTRLFVDMLPCGTMYIRSNTHNWTPDSGGVLVAQLFDEFKAAPIYLREARRRTIEDVAVTQDLRDGTEDQQDIWYNTDVFRQADALRILNGDAATEGWAELKDDYEFKDELSDELNKRATYMIHDRTPQGDVPIPLSGGARRQTERPDYTLAPGAYQDPDNLAILNAIDHPEWGIRPAYTSEWFPYGGYNIVREGWEPDSGSGTLFCSPKPGAYGAFRSRSNNNIFGLNAFGQDMLIDDSAGHYMYPSSPIKVDGLGQFFHAGLYKVGDPSGHKAYEIRAWQDPANWRWHSSAKFNLMEGVYAGPWAKPTATLSTLGPYGVEQSDSGTMPLAGTLQGVTHQRLAMYLRGPKFWILTDRLLSDGAHDYDQVWMMPTRPDGVAFLPESITVDAANRRITTSDDSTVLRFDGVKVHKANLSMYQFSAAQLNYVNKSIPQKPIGGRVLGYGHEVIDVTWKGSGSQQVVTAIMPRAPGTGPEGDLKNLRQITSGKAGIGFEATAPDGTVVDYLASTEIGDALTAGQVAVHGGALLLAGTGGMALDCRDMTVAGKPVALIGPDFEFALESGGAPVLTPIYRPIAPVKVGPERNVFNGSVDVTLTSETPRVQIHYTLDGTEPTPQSPLYTSPVTLSVSATVKARAYRPGVTANPPQTSGTDVTVTTTGVFRRADLAPPAMVARPQPGLLCNYYEGQWQKLFLDFDDMQPAASAPVPKLWDLSLIPSSNPPVGEAPAPRAKIYAVEYTGYLNIPQDGVYTLHAPDEMIWPDKEAGYELRVYLGQRIGTGNVAGRVIGVNYWYPTTRRHAFGTWSVALAKGPQPFRVVFMDFRRDAAKLLNIPGIQDYVWTGVTPDLRISGPGIDDQPIPSDWLMHAPAPKTALPPLLR